jgi:hypothetical protein
MTAARSLRAAPTSMTGFVPAAGNDHGRPSFLPEDVVPGSCDRLLSHAVVAVSCAATPCRANPAGGELAVAAGSRRPSTESRTLLINSVGVPPSSSRSARLSGSERTSLMKAEVSRYAGKRSTGARRGARRASPAGWHRCIGRVGFLGKQLFALDLAQIADDPRHELAFHVQLGDYSRELRQEGGGVTRAWVPGAAPDGWTGRA